jgi:RecA/RadA recombinase
MAKHKQTEEEEKPKELSSEQQIDSFLKDNEEFHYNNVIQQDYAVSSGSLKMDIEMGGGLRPGIVRFSGVTEGGKTSCALSFARSFQKNIPNSKVVYIKAEGRLSEDIISRAGINTDKDKWFVFKCNIYETSVQLINELIHNNPTNRKYFFIIDSMDSLNLKEDMNRVFGTANKVAGAAYLTADFLKKMALPLSSLGHTCIMISQIRTAVSINPYEKKDPRVTNASGGNAMLHYSDWILEFQTRYRSDLITSLPELKGEVLGHFCKIIFRKSPNEKTYKEISYPIKYGRTGGTSIWVEYEIADLMIMFEMVKVKTAWITVEPEILEELKKQKFEIPEKIQGLDNFRKLLETNENLTKYLYQKFEKVLKKNT